MTVARWDTVTLEFVHAGFRLSLCSFWCSNRGGGGSYLYY